MHIRSILPWIEGLAAGALVPLAGLTFPADPTFSSIGYLPQVIVPILVAALLGVAPGAVSLAAGAASTALLPQLGALLGLVLAAPVDSVLEEARTPAAAALFGVLAAGSMRDAAASRERRLLERFRDLVKRNTRLSAMTDTLTIINEELEARVSGQRESVSTLYARIRKLESLDLDKVLDSLLKAVEAFSQAERAAVYEYDEGRGVLALRAFAGAEPERELAIEGSVEGWVFRNESTFSLRMLNSYLNLARLESKGSILAYPLRAGDRVWGVLDILEMPFYRYNPTTEKNLEIIVSLASAYIRRAVDFRDRVLSRPRNEVTGLPGFGELVSMLGDEIAARKGGRGSVSFVVIEFLDFDRLVFSHSGVKALSLLKEIALANRGEEGRAIAFHYKEDSQLAFLLPGVDRDGASLFCLELMERVNAGAWVLDGEEIRLETIFGLAAAGPSSSAESVFADAEALLALSRGAMSGRGSNGTGGPGAAPGAAQGAAP